MNINLIKKRIELLKNEQIKIKVYLGRNKFEYFIGKIDKLHSNIFTVKTDSGIKSFTYSDVLIKNVVITKI